MRRRITSALLGLARLVAGDEVFQDVVFRRAAQAGLSSKPRVIAVENPMSITVFHSMRGTPYARSMEAQMQQDMEQILIKRLRAIGAIRRYITHRDAATKAFRMEMTFVASPADISLPTWGVKNYE